MHDYEYDHYHDHETEELRHAVARVDTTIRESQFDEVCRLMAEADENSDELACIAQDALGWMASVWQNDLERERRWDATLEAAFTALPSRDVAPVKLRSQPCECELQVLGS